MTLEAVSWSLNIKRSAERLKAVASCDSTSCVVQISCIAAESCEATRVDALEQDLQTWQALMVLPTSLLGGICRGPVVGSILVTGEPRNLSEPSQGKSFVLLGVLKIRGL